jgi:O-antigen/teichoic acid export membrane protein
MISASEMGRYVVALSLSRTLNAVYQAAAAVLFPKCVGLKPRGAVQAMIRLTAASTAVVLPGAAILYFFGSVLLRLMYGSEYVIASTLLRILVFEAIFSGLTTLMSQPFMALGRPGTVTVLQALGLAATIPLLLLLVPRMGTVGAGLALLISAALRFLLLQLSYVRLAGRLPRLRDLSSLTESMVPARFSRRIAVEVRQ